MIRADWSHISPTGRHCSGGSCVRDPTRHCAVPGWALVAAMIVIQGGQRKRPAVWAVPSSPSAPSPPPPPTPSWLYCKHPRIDRWRPTMGSKWTMGYFDRYPIPYPTAPPCGSWKCIENGTSLSVQPKRQTKFVDRRVYMVCFKFCDKYSDMKASVPIKHWLYK